MSDDDFDITKAYIISLFLESIFFGVYLVSFVLCMRYLIWERCPEFKLNKTPNWKFIIITVLLQVLTAVHVSCALARILRAPDSERNWVDIIASTGIGVAVVTIDAILIYRCWIIYMKQWIIIIMPVLLWTGSVAITIYSIVEQVRYHPQSPPSRDTTQRPGPHVRSWVIFLALTIAQNILTTALIAWRITIIDRASSQYRIRSRVSRYQRSVRLIIESGALCTVAACLAFITFLAGGKFGLIAADLEIQLVSIAFNLIIIRSANRPEEYSLSPASTGSVRLHELFKRSQQSILATSSAAESNTPPKPVEICIINEVLESRDGQRDTIKA